MGLLVAVLVVEADAVDAVAMLLSALVFMPAAAEGADKNEALLPPTGGEKDTADVPGRSELFGALPPPLPFAEPPLALLLVVRRKGRGRRLMVGGRLILNAAIAIAGLKMGVLWLLRGIARQLNRKSPFR